MPARSPRPPEEVEQALRLLGQAVRTQRKRLRISATAAAEAAGMSRVTLYRIEKGEPSVAMGAYLSAVGAVGLELELRERAAKRSARRPQPRLPPAIALADYPQLKRLAWQLRGETKIAPKEALDVYERNWRHIDFDAIDLAERQLIDALLARFGRERPLV